MSGGAKCESGEDIAISIRPTEKHTWRILAMGKSNNGTLYFVLLKEAIDDGDSTATIQIVKNETTLQETSAAKELLPTETMQTQSVLQLKLWANYNLFVSLYFSSQDSTPILHVRKAEHVGLLDQKDKLLVANTFFRLSENNVLEPVIPTVRCFPCNNISQSDK